MSIMNPNEIRIILRALGFLSIFPDLPLLKILNNDISEQLINFMISCPTFIMLWIKLQTLKVMKQRPYNNFME